MPSAVSQTSKNFRTCAWDGADADPLVNDADESVMIMNAAALSVSGFISKDSS